MLPSKPFHRMFAHLTIIITSSSFLSDGFLVGPKYDNSRRQHLFMTMPASEQARLLQTEPAQTAFVTAEMRSFLTLALKRTYNPSGHIYDAKWEMSTEDKFAANLIDVDGNTISDEYRDATHAFMDGGGAAAVDKLCNTTSITFKDGFLNQPGLLSNLGSAICFFRVAYRTPTNLAACERVGLSDYAVAHHITDMYHHYNFRGAYTKTLTPSGAGEIAARMAVGLDALRPSNDNSNRKSAKNTTIDKDIIQNELSNELEEEEEDECILWSPTTEGVCIHWKSDDEAWREKRFQRIQMEGTRDPRRGGSGTTR